MDGGRQFPHPTNLQQGKSPIADLIAHRIVQEMPTLEMVEVLEYGPAQ